MAAQPGGADRADQPGTLAGSAATFVRVVEGVETIAFWQGGLGKSGAALLPLWLPNLAGLTALTSLTFRSPRGFGGAVPAVVAGLPALRRFVFVRAFREAPLALPAGFGRLGGTLQQLTVEGVNWDVLPREVCSFERALVGFLACVAADRGGRQLGRAAARGVGCWRVLAGFWALHGWARRCSSCPWRASTWTCCRARYGADVDVDRALVGLVVLTWGCAAAREVRRRQSMAGRFLSRVFDLNQSAGAGVPSQNPARLRDRRGPPPRPCSRRPEARQRAPGHPRGPDVCVLGQVLALRQLRVLVVRSQSLPRLTAGVGGLALLRRLDLSANAKLEIDADVPLGALWELRSLDLSAPASWLGF